MAVGGVGAFQLVEQPRQFDVRGATG